MPSSSGLKYTFGFHVIVALTALALVYAVVASNLSLPTPSSFNFKALTTQAGSSDNASGYAWGENLGWVSFNCTDSGTCGTINYGVNVDSVTGNLSGYAWNEFTGWISFNTADVAGCPAGTCQPKITNGVATGWARARTYQASTTPIDVTVGWQVTSDPTDSIDRLYGLYADTDYIYSSGVQGTSTACSTGGWCWLTEKHDKATGALVSSFGTGGRVTSDPSTLNDLNNAIDGDSSYIYLAGNKNTSCTAGGSCWRIEKRDKTTGALVSGFGTGGIIHSDPGPSSDWLYEIFVDGNYIYAAGIQYGHLTLCPVGSGCGRIEKRDKTTGALVAGFGSGGAITIDPTFYNDSVSGLVTDESYLYVVGDAECATGSNSCWRIEKRNKTTGALVGGFGSGGGVTTDLSGTDDGASEVLVDSSYLYIVGYQGTGGSCTGSACWHVEKRDKTTGALVSGFGSGGVLVGDYGGSSRTLVLGSDGLYIGGYMAAGGLCTPGTSCFRIEKRDLVTGDFVTAFGSGGVYVESLGSGSNRLAEVALDANSLFFSGYYTSSGCPLGGSGVCLRFEKLDRIYGKVVLTQSTTTILNYFPTISGDGWDGWISLNCLNTNTCGTSNYTVTASGGEFNGYAWGGDPYGWIQFNCLESGTCGTSNFKVALTGSAPTISSFTASSPIAYNANSQLDWLVSNATSCTASGGWSGSKATSGTQSVGPLLIDTSFTLACSNPFGTTQQTRAVTVAPAPDFSIIISKNVKKTSVQVESSTTTISISSQGGFNSAIALSASPSSLGSTPITYQFSDISLSSSEYATGSVLSITSSSTIPSGQYTITITGNGSGTIRQGTFILDTTGGSRRIEEF